MLTIGAGLLPIFPELHQELEVHTTPSAIARTTIPPTEHLPTQQSQAPHTVNYEIQLIPMNTNQL